MTLHEIKSEPNDALIEQIETLLDKAKAGEIQCLVSVQAFADGSTGGSWAGLKYNHMAILGELEVIKRDIIDNSCTLLVDQL